MTRGFSDLPDRTPRATSPSLAVPTSSAAVAPTSPRVGWFRRTLVVSAIGLFAGAAAIGMVSQPDRTALPPASVVQSILPMTADAMSVSASVDTPYINETRIRSGDTLAAVLQRLELDEPGLQTFLTHDASARSIYKLYPGRSVQAATDAEGKLVWLRYIHTPGNDSEGQVVTKMLHVVPDGTGYAADELVENTDRQTRVAVGTIKSSLFGATDAAGIPDSITLQMADILAGKVDFLRDLRQGDQFRVVYETRSHDGRYAGAGRVMAVEFINQGKTYNAVWFSANGNGQGAYYDFDGTNLRGTFLKTALKFTRISSTFGGRMHPIHGRWMGHKGVDYAAPTGTPIHSVADGTIEFAGTQSGYGNIIVIKHSDKYTTAYAHQSRLAEGMRKGTKVSQGQLIGYVGSTGWATGPHLHYEFRVDGQPIDPLAADLPIARTLDAKEVQAFNQAVDPYKQQIGMLAQLQTISPDSLTNVAAR